MAAHDSNFTEFPQDLSALIGADDGPRFSPSRRVYTNRDLDLADIKLVGFDMDYTLAIYRKEPMEQLQYDLTVERLVETHGYPHEIRVLKYDPTFIIRGLTVDKRTGNLFKMDTHGGVTRCIHGRKVRTPDEFRPFYNKGVIRVSSQDFASLDTLFAMPEACLYANLVEFFEDRVAQGLDACPLTLPAAHETPNLGLIDTWKLFHDVRNSIDDIHRDGTLKSIIMADIGRYIAPDDALPVTLHKLRSAGKRLFLLTNSYWTYTDCVMRFLLDGKLPEYPSWRGYFDNVIVGGRKPGFFTMREPFLEVATEDDKPLARAMTSDRFERQKVYQGGNMESFEIMAGCGGREILYVGDHIFGDILRSKKDSGWRTCLIVEELEAEIEGILRHRDAIDAIGMVDEERHALDERLGHERARLALLDVAVVEAKERGLSGAELERLEEAQKLLRREIDKAKRALRGLDKTTREQQLTLDAAFNPWWGPLLKDRNENSRFGQQVQAYACTYTSRVSNFLQYSPVHFFRAPRDLMSHEYAIANSRGLRNVARLEADRDRG